MRRIGQRETGVIAHIISSLRRDRSGTEGIERDTARIQARIGDGYTADDLAARLYGIQRGCQLSVVHIVDIIDGLARPTESVGRLPVEGANLATQAGRTIIVAGGRAGDRRFDVVDKARKGEAGGAARRHNVPR